MCRRLVQRDDNNHQVLLARRAMPILANNTTISYWVFADPRNDDMAAAWLSQEARWIPEHQRLLRPFDEVL